MYSNSNRLLMNNMKGGGSKQRAMEEEMMEESPLSGAYIRNLVKQLTTSSPPPKTQHKSQLDNTPHKKQVRRRLHTTKPYQERLLNMAEARKEIVTALKFHRASMKQQQQQQQQQQQSTPPPNLFSDLPSPAAGVVLPNQTLGLSLSSFQELTNLDAACLYGRSGGSSSSTVIPSDITPSDVTPSDVGLAGSRALGDQEMEEIKSIGEMHDMEWNDTLNLANSAWWFKYLNTMEVGQQLLDFPSTHLQLPCINIEDIEALDEEWLT